MYARREVAMQAADEAAIRAALASTGTPWRPAAGVLLGTALAGVAFPIALSPHAGAWVLAAAAMLLVGVAVASSCVYLLIVGWLPERRERAAQRRSCRESLRRGVVVEIEFVADVAWRFPTADGDGVRLLYRVGPDAFVLMTLDPESDDDAPVPAAWRIRRTVGEAPILLGEESVARLGTIEANSRKPGKKGRSGVGRGLIADPLDGELVSAAEAEAWLGTRTDLGERPVAS